MKITTQDTERTFRYYMLKTIVGVRLWRVRTEDVGEFIEILGDMIVGAGDTREEAIQDYERRKKQRKKR